MRKLLSILLLFVCPVLAKDYKSITIHRHDNTIVAALLPDHLGGVQLLCVGDQKTMEYQGLDCYPAIHRLKLPTLDDDVRETERVLDRSGAVGRYTFPIRVGIPESMF